MSGSSIEIALASGAMNPASPRILLYALAVGSLMAGCSDSASRETTEMSVVQDLQIRFGAMAANEPAFATLTLDELRSLPDFETHQESFECAAVDLQRTHLTLTTLTGPGPQTAVAITAAIRDGADTLWIPLLSLQGFAAQAEPLAPGPGDLHGPGEAAMEAILLGPVESLVVRVEAETVQDLELLELELTLVLFFSTEASGCGAHRESLASDSL